MYLKVVVSNQTIVGFSNGIEVFFSYDTPVVIYIPDRGYLRTTTHYSKTTTGHINQYLQDRAFEFVPGEEFDRLIEIKVVLA